MWIKPYAYKASSNNSTINTDPKRNAKFFTSVYTPRMKRKMLNQISTLPLPFVSFYPLVDFLLVVMTRQKRQGSWWTSCTITLVQAASTGGHGAKRPSTTVTSCDIPTASTTSQCLENLGPTSSGICAAGQKIDPSILSGYWVCVLILPGSPSLVSELGVTTQGRVHLLPEAKHGVTCKSASA